MRRSTIGLMLFVFLLAGCGDRHRPVVRRGGADSLLEDTGQVQPDDTGQVEPSPRAGPAEVPEQPPGTDAREVNLGTMRLTAPEGWVRKRPAVSFILAEFSLPRAEGDEADGRLTVSIARGTIEENVDRWRGQFGGKPDKESVQQVEVAGVQVTVVDFSGTYADQRGMAAPAVQQPRYRMLGAIVPLEGDLFFVKCYGPEKTVAARADEFHAFLRSLSPRKPAP